MHFRLAISRKMSRITPHLHFILGWRTFNPKTRKIIMKTISVLALTAVAILASCQQQQQQQQTTTPAVEPVQTVVTK